MDRIEAIKVLNRFPVNYTGMTINEANRVDEALAMATSALRPVSREWVEKVWRGEWIDTNHRTSSCKCTKCGAVQEYETPFCPACGASMTDEAVEMVMERMEALKDGSTAD